MGHSIESRFYTSDPLDLTSLTADFTTGEQKAKVKSDDSVKKTTTQR